MDFELLGYSEEYYQNNKYVGSVKIAETNRVTGYSGREHYKATEDIVFKNALGKEKKIRKNTEYYTEVIILCGKMIGSQKDKINRLASSFEWRNQSKLSQYVA